MGGHRTVYKIIYTRENLVLKFQNVSFGFQTTSDLNVFERITKVAPLNKPMDNPKEFSAGTKTWCKHCFTLFWDTGFTGTDAQIVPE